MISATWVAIVDLPDPAGPMTTNMCLVEDMFDGSWRAVDDQKKHTSRVSVRSTLPVETFLRCAHPDKSWPPAVSKEVEIGS